MTYSIWLVPSYGDKKYLNKIINDLAKKHGAPKFSAHITVYSGITSLRKAKAAVQSLDSCKIRVYKTGIGQSNYLWKTIFVKIKKSFSFGGIAIVRSSKRVKDWKVIYKASLGAA